MSKKKFKMQLAGHLKSSLEDYIARYKDTYYKRVQDSKAIENLDEIISVESDNLNIDMAKLRAVESDIINLKGSQRVIVSNFVTATLNLIGLNKVKGLDFSSVKPKSY